MGAPRWPPSPPAFGRRRQSRRHPLFRRRRGVMLNSRGMTAQVRPLDPGDGSRALRPVILVVDDEPGLRESFRLILDDEYEVIDVPDGPAALDVLRSSQVDLVLLDIRLPGMDGIEVLERIKALDEAVAG